MASLGTFITPTLTYGLGPTPKPVPGETQLGDTLFKQFSPTSDPTFASLLERTTAAVPGAPTGVQQITQQALASPLIQAVLGPALQRLVAPQQMQQQQLTDAARAAGSTRDSSYGQSMSQLMGQQGLQQNDLISSLLSHLLPSLLNSQLQEQQQSFLPARTLTDILGLTKPTVVSGQTNAANTSLSNSNGGWGSIPPSMGLQTPMMGDTTRVPNIPLEGYGWMGGSSPSSINNSTVSSTGVGYGQARAPVIDPLTQYLLGNQGPANPIVQSDPSSWMTVNPSYNDYASTNWEY